MRGRAAEVCRWVCSQGCPGLSFRAESLPRSALSLPGEIPMVLWGEAVGGKTGQGRVLLVVRRCCVGQGCSKSHSGHWEKQHFKRKVKAGTTFSAVS